MNQFNKEFRKRHWRKFFTNPNVIILFVFVVIDGTLTAFEFTHESDMTATVVSINTQQRTTGDKDGFTTTYSYLVATDCGTLEISPNGIMASSKFGTLQEGKRYTFHLRGFSLPLIGLYPYIIDAELNE